MNKKNGRFNKKTLIDQLKNNINQVQAQAADHLKQHYTCIGYQLGIADVLKLLEKNGEKGKTEKS